MQWAFIEAMHLVLNKDSSQQSNESKKPIKLERK